jgi:DegV family protein with EDD domain
MNTIIITDSNCDLPEEYLKENNIPVIPFHFNLNGKDYEDNFGKTISYKKFYDELRNGGKSTTSQITPYTYEEYYRKYVNEGCSIIYIAFSSALSESYNHSLLARENVLQEFPNADITVIDSKAASVGQGMLVQKAVDMLKDGKTNKELITWLESNKMKVNQWFTVDSLEHLKRGGRLSTTSFVLGTLMSVKPVLIVDKDGKLSPIKKVRGRKKAIRELYNEFKNTATNINNETVYISHADCFEDAQYLKELIDSELTVKEVAINNLGPIIGTHTGPGLLSLAFMGQERV